MLRFAVPMQVAAVCYRLRPGGVEFLLVRTSGNKAKWTFPKGCSSARLSHSEAAEREAWEEAGARGMIEARHFHIYVHSKGVFWKAPGVQEYVVKAFLMEVEDIRKPLEAERDPTWFSPSEAKRILAKGREAKYREELETLVDRALERIRSNRQMTA